MIPSSGGMRLVGRIPPECYLGVACCICCNEPVRDMAQRSRLLGRWLACCQLHESPGAIVGGIRTGSPWRPCLMLRTATPDLPG